jgi:hypothetical protein
MKKIIIPALVTALALSGEFARADFTFGMPENLGPTVNSSSMDGVPSISTDGLEMFFNSNRPNGHGEFDLWVTTRATIENQWGEPVNLGSIVNTSDQDGGPFISADGLSLYFTSTRPGGYGSWDVWVTMRATREDEWSTPMNLEPPVNTFEEDRNGSISVDGLTLFFASKRTGSLGSNDLWVTNRDTTNDPWSEPVSLGPTVNTSSDDVAPRISPDGRLLFFMSDRAGGYGFYDVWVTRRATKDDDWGVPVNLGPPVNTLDFDAAANISANGSTLYFMSGRPGGFGGFDIWQVSIEPVVDLNGDGIVDAADMCIIVDNWGTDEPSSDIGPTPFGDSIVDVEDLIVLSDFVMGGPIWQPASGMIDGALELDGIDDCLICGTGPNPAEGPFSVIAWIKGSTLGQVIISQPNGSDLLAIDAEGNLMTELNGSDQSIAPLLSQALITDEQWHRIGLVWDGSRRALFVDGIQVAKDTEDSQGTFSSGLYIGVGKIYAEGTFFSGLIDDVRIYNRVVSP